MSLKSASYRCPNDLRSAAGYIAETVFQCPIPHDRAADDDNAQIYRALMDAGIAEAEHRARIAEGEDVARQHLKPHWGAAIALAERLAECGHERSPAHRSPLPKIALGRSISRLRVWRQIIDRPVCRGRLRTTQYRARCRSLQMRSRITSNCTKLTTTVFKVAGYGIRS